MFVQPNTASLYIFVLVFLEYGFPLPETLQAGKMSGTYRY